MESIDIAYVSLELRQLVGWVFLTSGGAKALKVDDFRADLRTYLGRRRSLTSTSVLVVPALEILVGLSLVAGLWWRAAALVAVVLLIGFSVAVAWAARRGRVSSCGCGGLAPAQGGTRAHLFANVVLAAAAGVTAASPASFGTIHTPAAWPPQGASEGSFEVVAAVSGAAVLLLLYTRFAESILKIAATATSQRQSSVQSKEPEHWKTSGRLVSSA